MIGQPLMMRYDVHELLPTLMQPSHMQAVSCFVLMFAHCPTGSHTEKALFPNKLRPIPFLRVCEEC